MRILLINDYGTATGGAELVCLRLREGLRARGHDVRLFTSSAQPGGAPVLADDQCYGTLGRHRTLLQAANPWARGRLTEVVRAFRPDVAHVRMFLTQLSPLVLDALNDVPTLLHVATYRPICPLGTKRLPNGSPCASRPGRVCLREGCLPLRDWLPLMMQERLWHDRRGRVDRVAANSAWVRHRLESEGMRVDMVVTNGVVARPSRPSLAAPPTAAFAGRLQPEKGVRLLLEAFAAVVQDLPEARLLVVGDGPDHGELRADAGRLGLTSHVSFLGHLERNQMEEVLEPAWVHVVPSTWEEPFGTVAAEAMMRGTAVIASDHGGLPEQVRHDVTGLLVPPDDTEALTSALIRILSDRGLAEAMGREGRQVALRDFSHDRFVEDVEAAYRRLVG